jgi:hypothetical protein
MTPHPENPRRGVITAEKIDLDFHDILKQREQEKQEWRYKEQHESLPTRRRKRVASYAPE